MFKTPDYISNLKPYVPGKSIEELEREFGLTEIHKLASNENPLGHSPLANESMMKMINEINRYPDVGAVKLREKISEKFGIPFKNIAVGSGSEGIMANLLRCYLCEEDEMITSEATFIGFQVLARGRANKTHYVPMSKKTYKFDLNGILDRINTNTKMIYLCNPNNPTGTIITKKEFDEFHKQVPQGVMIILDEAYFEYADIHDEYPNSLFYRYDNVVTFRTFSKIYGIAGLRIGYAMGQEDIVTTLMKSKLPFEPNTLAQAAALGALDDDAFLNKSIELNNHGYEYFKRELAGLEIKGSLKLIPSYANFIMLDLFSEEKVNTVNETLLSRGVIIRPLKPFGLANCIRVTMGLMNENEAFIREFKKLL
ncbi:MAG: histidinol-phosphate transaminase [Ignavibacteria bacterium]|nr:histidinol-phosphate transaminase [Ignavibacteria bacterium]